ncbi:MAG: ssDNA exonuclease RecJ [Gammaproteobacteria bacterium]|nr:ssDNA exonuclease RecJ [Gammaproteobacteria bacterium]
MPKQIIRREHSHQHTLPPSMHPVLRRIYSARNIARPEELDTSLSALLPYHSLLGIEQAVLLLSAAINNQQRILILADYDADGATGCALAVRGLRAMGASSVQYLVPSRFNFGYGLSPEIVTVAAAMKPDLLVTVDNGISSIEGVRLARSMGMAVLITDHHLAREQLPDANVIVNPNQPGDVFPSKCLAGVGVMFYILAALRAHLRDSNWFATNGVQEPNLAALLDIVALGTVADVVPLDFNNRILVAQGLARIRSGRGVPGINALLAVAKRSPARVTAGDLGFSVGPRLNAAGRLEDMSLGIECLLCDDAARAMAMAMQLDELNRERREIQQDMQDIAEREMSTLALDGTVPFGLCLYKENWHQGVIGILAAKIKDQWNRPVIAFADDRDGMLKGSARSVAAVHIRDLLDAIARREPHLIDRFGGHAMAAGLTIRREMLERFRELFDAEVRRHLSSNDLAGTIVTDGELSPADMNLSLAETINSAGPWGHEFPEPLFDGVFAVADRRVIGQKHLKLALKTVHSDRTYDAMAFFTNAGGWVEAAESIRLVYRLNVNEYKGQRKLQLLAEHMEPV